MCDRAGRFLVGFILGSLMGGMVALLLAPAPGEDTRRVVAERAEEAAREARQRGWEYQERGSEVLTEGRGVLQQAIEEAGVAAAQRAAELRDGLKPRRTGEEPEANSS